jgi:hypothetical protein
MHVISPNGTQLIPNGILFRTIITIVNKHRDNITSFKSKISKA